MPSPLCKVELDTRDLIIFLFEKAQVNKHGEEQREDKQTPC